MKKIRFNYFLSVLAGLIGVAAIARAENLAAIFTNVAPAATTAMPRRANIILIQADSLGYGDLSCDGQTKFQTPNLDKLATEGIRFTNYQAGAAASSPARAALLLGQDAGDLKQQAGMAVPLTADEITIAQILKKSGYQTSYIGEWDLGGDGTSGAPWKKGFNEFAGYFDPADAKNYYADYMWRHAPGSLINPTNNQREDFNGREMIYVNTQGKNRYIPDLYTKAAMNFIADNRQDQFNRYRPYFLMVNYATPDANAAETKRTGNGMEVPTDAPFSSEAWPQPEKNRAAMITRLDGDIGKLLEQLRKTGQTNNTVIFFSSTGVAKKAGGADPAFFHSNVSTNDQRVPMIVRWPGTIPAGQVSGHPWSAKDFLPTAADIALLKPPEKIDGASVLPVLLGRTETNRAAKN
jgi:arylsulfatase A-like enzyme